MMAMAVWKGWADENASGTTFGYSFALHIVGYCCILVACFLFYEAVEGSKDGLFTPDRVHKAALCAMIVAIFGFILTIVGVALPSWGTTEALPAFSGNIGLFQYCWEQQAVGNGCSTIDAECKTCSAGVPCTDITLKECMRVNSVRGFAILAILFGVGTIVGCALAYFKDSSRGKLFGFVLAVISAVCGYIAMGVWLQYFERQLEAGGFPGFPFPNPGLGAAFGLHVAGAVFYTIAAILAYITFSYNQEGGVQVAAQPAEASTPA
jgi:Co/Zn/Cd efflux system component